MHCDYIGRCTKPCECPGFATTDTSRIGWHEGRAESARIVGGSDAAVSGDEPGVALLPTPTSCDYKPTDSPSDLQRHSPGLGAVSAHFSALLPTPTASDCTGGGQDPDRRIGHTAQLIDEVLTTRWGKYAPAIARWEQIVGPAPAPTEPNRNGNPRLSADFSQWLMGWPAGWVTDPAIGISRNDQLRIIGNGVVSLQCEYALRYLLSVAEVSR